MINLEESTTYVLQADAQQLSQCFVFARGDKVDLDPQIHLVSAGENNRGIFGTMHMS